MDTETLECTVPGQVVLPGMADELGYEAIELEPWKERFCWEYVLRGDNGFRAYKTVKPKVKDSTARVEASKTLTIPAVIRRIEQIKAEQRRRYQVTADDLMTYYGKVLKIDRREFVERTDAGRVVPKNIMDLDDDVAGIVDIGFMTDNDGNLHPSFSVPERPTSAAALAKIMGLIKEKRELSGPDGGPIETNGKIQFYMPDNGRD